MVIALIALIVVGPEQLPGVLRKLGQTAAHLRSRSSSLRDEFMTGLDQANPTKWGQGTANSPIVPRGYAKATMTATGAAATEPDSKEAGKIETDAAPAVAELTGPEATESPGDRVEAIGPDEVAS